MGWWLLGLYVVGAAVVIVALTQAVAANARAVDELREMLRKWEEEERNGRRG